MLQSNRFRVFGGPRGCARRGCQTLKPRPNPRELLIATEEYIIDESRAYTGKGTQHVLKDKTIKGVIIK